MILLFALLFATPAPVWQFEGEPASPHHIHLLHDGIDLGRTAAGTIYDGAQNTVTVVVLDEIAKRGFE